MNHEFELEPCPNRISKEPENEQAKTCIPNRHHVSHLPSVFRADGYAPGTFKKQ